MSQTDPRPAARARKDEALARANAEQTALRMLESRKAAFESSGSGNPIVSAKRAGRDAEVEALKDELRRLPIDITVQQRVVDDASGEYEAAVAAWREAELPFIVERKRAARGVLVELAEKFRDAAVTYRNLEASAFTTFRSVVVSDDERPKHPLRPDTVQLPPMVRRLYGMVVETTGNLSE